MGDSLLVGNLANREHVSGTGDTFGISCCCRYASFDPFARSILLGEHRFFGMQNFRRVCVGGLLGILTAVGAARYTRFRELMAPLVSVIKTTPVASFVILALFWFSSRSLSIFISFLMVFPIVYTNILQGISQTDRQLLEMGQVFGLSMKKKIRYIYFPQVFPYLRSAFAVGLGLCWKAGTAAEVIGIPDGSIGERLQEAKIYLQMPDLFAWTVTIIVVSLLIEKLILWILDVIDRRNRGIGKA